MRSVFVISVLLTLLVIFSDHAPDMIVAVLRYHLAMTNGSFQLKAALFQNPVGCDVAHIRVPLQPVEAGLLKDELHHASHGFRTDSPIPEPRSDAVAHHAITVIGNIEYFNLADYLMRLFQLDSPEIVR